MKSRLHAENIHEAALYGLASGVCLGEGLGLGALVLLLLVCIFRRKELPWRTLATGPSVFWLSGWMIWFAAGLLMLIGSGEGALKPSEGFRHITILAMPLVYISLRSLPERAVNRSVKIAGFILTLSALFGLYQWFSGSHPFAFLARADSSIATQARIPGQENAMAATGFFFHRLKMAHVLVAGIGVSLYWALARPQGQRIPLALAGLYTVCLFGTYAKAAMGAALGAALLIAGLLFFRRVVWLIALIVAGAAGGLTLYDAEISQLFQGSMGVRQMIWSHAAQIIGDYPAGAGLGNYPSLVGRYYDLTNPAFHVRTYPHNLLLSWWAESGIIGMVGLACGWIAATAYCVRCIISPKVPRSQKYLSAGLVFSLVSFWIIGLTHDVLYHPSVALVFFSTIGWFMAQSRDEKLREIK